MILENCDNETSKSQDVSPPCDSWIFSFYSIKISSVKSKDVLEAKSGCDNDVVTRSMNEAYDYMYSEYIRMNGRYVEY